VISKSPAVLKYLTERSIWGISSHAYSVDRPRR